MTESHYMYECVEHRHMSDIAQCPVCVPVGRKQWLKSLRDARITGCGRLDANTTLLDEVKAGRVVSDRIRYVYFEDGTEVACVGKFCDHVAFRAAEHEELRQAARELASLTSTTLRAIELGAVNLKLKGETSIGATVEEVFITNEEAFRRLSEKVYERTGPHEFECPKCGGREFHPVATCKR